MKARDMNDAWHGVVIEADLSTYPVGETETLAQCAALSQVGYTDSEVARAARKVVPLTEENVETLLTAALAHVFPIDNLMLIARQRALLQVPDLLAIDPIGRLTIIELKNKPARAIEIVSQVNEYLVQCAQRDGVELTRHMQDYYRQYAIFQPLYHAGLLLRRCVEHSPGLGRFLKESGSYPDQKKDSSVGGDTYRRKMGRIARSIIQEQYGVDVMDSGARVLAQIRGEPGYSKTDLATAVLTQFKYPSEYAGVLQQAINRRWRQIYFAPSFWFQRSEQEDADRNLTGTLAAMHFRGMEMSFIEYSLVCREQHSSPWLLAWRATDQWLSAGTDKGNALAWRHAGAAFDRYTENLLRKGCLAKKWPGRYGNWEFVEPDREDMSVYWPSGGNPDHLSAGEVYYRGDSANREEMQCLRDHIAGTIPDVSLSVAEIRSGIKLKWECEAGEMETCADIASQITLTALDKEFRLPHI